MQKNNKVNGNLAGRDINIYEKQTEDIFHYFEKLSKDVNSKLHKGVYNYYKNKFVKYDSLVLFESLVEIAIPSIVAYTVVKNIPEAIDKEISELNGEVFSTRNIRHMVYSLLKKLDYEKIGIPRISMWGENYIRKYGHSDIELQVIIDEENRIELLDRKFIEKKLLPELYFKCYNANLDEDLKLLKSKTLLGDISSEILEKVRLLNLYYIRYSTLRKLSYDLAIQPPHHWFTDKAFRNKQIEYNIGVLTRKKELFEKKIQTEHSAKEFIEHSCATILSLYSLFIGIGKFRPLISLLNYFVLKDANPLFWENIELSNFPDDLQAINRNITFYKLKFILEQVKHKIQNVEENYDYLLTEFSNLFDIVIELINLDKILKNFKPENNDLNSIKESTLFLLKFYGNLKIRNESYFTEEFKNVAKPEGMLSTVRIGYLFIDNNAKILKIEGIKAKNSNALLLVINIKISKEIIKQIITDHLIEEEYIYTLTITDLASITRSLNRSVRLEMEIEKSLL